MSNLVLHLTIITICLFALTATSIATTRIGIVRFALLALFVTITGVVYYAMTDAIGRAKSVSIETLQSEEAEVLGALAVNEEYLFLMLAMEGIEEPRLYVTDYDESKMQQLQDAMDEGEEQGTKVMMSKPFEKTLDRQERVFHAEPQEALAPKTPPQGGWIELPTESEQPS